ncbi:MAG: type II toxin-antitoxin system Phd/YefM family antitoxin [Deltaproteobacteria bacterium]|nr:type II toxin-antitoxin system Phd/YefM family antitoxin [Deltaproteobacteria bacterium]
MVKRKTAVNVHQAKTHFSKLLARAERGERIAIARNGVPVAELVPIGADRQAARHFGECVGKIEIAEDFNAPLPAEVLASFYK